MQILYIDESGVEQLNVKPDHFVLLGLSIRAEYWKDQDNLIEKIKKSYGLDGIEIHTHWMFRKYIEQDRVLDFEKLSPDQRRKAAEEEITRRAGIIGVRGNQSKIKSYRVESRRIRPYLHLTRAERHKCLLDLAQEIGKWGKARIFAEAISKPDFTSSLQTPYEQAFEQVLTRFQAFLSRIDDTGIVVHDQNTTVAPRLTKLMRKFHKTGTFIRDIENIVETPFFVDSQLTSMIQLADLCAFFLRKYIENKDTVYWDTLKSRIDQVNGCYVGVRHYTGRRTCICQTCTDHGR
jgi:hypothetical protein